MAQPQQRDWTDDIDLSYEANETNAKQGDYYVEGFGAAAPVEDAPPADTASSRASTPTEILDEDDMGLRERASAYKAMWRDTGRAKKRATKRAPARVRLPLPKYGAVKKALRKPEKRAAAYAAAPVAFFPGDDGAAASFVDFELPYGLLVEAAKERAAERARKAGVRSLDVAFAEFELVRRNVFAHRAELRANQIFNPTSTCAYANVLTRALRPGFENSTRAFDPSQNQPNRRRFDRAREFSSLAPTSQLTG